MVKKINIFLVSQIIILTLLAPAFLSAEDKWESIAIWPNIEQPWYFQYPQGIAVDAQGNVYIADTNNGQIQKFMNDGKFITKWYTCESNAIAVDNTGYVYTACGNNEIKKYSLDGAYITKWGSSGSGDKQFDTPLGIAVDSSGNVYVSDTGNNRVQIFNANGDFISKFGAKGVNQGSFNSPRGIVVDSSGNIYVADFGNKRVQKFKSDGNFDSSFGTSGSGDGQFNSPYGIAIDNNGYIYVSDCGYYTSPKPGMITSYPGNERIQKFTPDGKFVTKWGKVGHDKGEFFLVEAIAVDSSGNVFTAEFFNSRVQKFSSNGTFLSIWSSRGQEDNFFSNPGGSAFDSKGNIYITDSWYQQVKKFTPDGRFITKWGSQGSGDGQFSLITFRIAIDSQDNVYMLDFTEDDAKVQRVQKFTSDGEFLTKWGSHGDGDGQFNIVSGIAIDSKDNIYIADKKRIQKFTPTGEFISKWGNDIEGEGKLTKPEDLAIDGENNIYVWDHSEHKIKKFTNDGHFIWAILFKDGITDMNTDMNVDKDGNLYVSIPDDKIQVYDKNGTLLTEFGSTGTNPGQFYKNGPLSISKDGTLYVSEIFNYRVQLFKKTSTISKPNKAVIIAGSGPSSYNNLWTETEMNVTRAYSVLLKQGFTKDNIYYLTAGRSVDLDSDGVLNDMTAGVSNDKLKEAITQRAINANDVVVYLLGHGGNGKFRINDNETLNVSDLNEWLNALEQSIEGKLIVVYDACESGSFLSVLKSSAAKERIIITSTSPSENAYFIDSGVLSFSYLFWSQVNDGNAICDSFEKAKNGISFVVNKQNPLIDSNNDGAYQKEDCEKVSRITIGRGIKWAGDRPSIESVTAPQELNGEQSAVITVSKVTTTSSLQRVWAVIMSPDFKPESSDAPVTSLPTVELKNKDNGTFEGTYSSFTAKGTYTVSVYAKDSSGNISIPKQITITQNTGSSAKPVPSIKANGLNADTNLKPTETLSLTVGLDAGSHTGTNADWWVFAYTSIGTYHYDMTGGIWQLGEAVTYQGPLFSFSPFEILNIQGLPAGTYTFHFQVDETVDGIKNGNIYSDSVTVNVTQ